MKDNRAEILSPAGSPETLEAAVRSGADAVYFGTREFSARRNAENFDTEELAGTVRFCHIRGVRCYLTLNICLHDNELEQALSVADSAYNAGIDGIIVQDLGLARLLHGCFPGLALHASTQLSVHSPSALPLLKELGFCQVVAAREMSLAELEVFCKRAAELSLTVEVFVHGALCMSVSGQCLLSAMLGSRSGNRGLCAGPCRLPFAAEGGTGFDLSLKDLSALDYLGRLYETGVRSFKIEGRMKRPEYVAAATAACRQAVDRGFVDASLSETLRNVFSRSGFTAGYLENRLGRDMFGIRTREDVSAAESAFPALHELYRSERQHVPVTLRAVLRRGEKISLTLSDGERTVTAFGSEPEDARSGGADAESILKSLSKLGGTPYFVSDTAVTLDEGIFVRVSVLNELRRSACLLLDDKRAAVATAVKQKFISGCADIVHRGKPLLYLRIEQSGQLPEDLSGFAALIFALENEPPEQLPVGIRLIADIPRGISDEDQLFRRLADFKKRGFTAAMCGNLAAVELTRRAGLEVIADTGLNLCNYESVNAAVGLGAAAVTLSAELLLSDAVKMKTPVEKGLIAYGRIPLMLFKNCPLKNGRSCAECDRHGFLTDRLGTRFPVRCRMGYSELLNSVPLWLADRMDELAGIDFAVLYFTNEDSAAVAEVASAYKKGLAPSVPHTRGLYYRGTI